MLKKYALCLPELNFLIEFPITFKFVPKSSQTTASTVSTSQAQSDKPIPCQSGFKQTTAFICDPCPAGFNCKDPNAPFICPGRGQFEHRNKVLRPNRRSTVDPT